MEEANRLSTREKTLMKKRLLSSRRIDCRGNNVNLRGRPLQFSLSTLLLLTLLAGSLMACWIFRDAWHVTRTIPLPGRNRALFTISPDGTLLATGQLEHQNGKWVLTTIVRDFISGKEINRCQFPELTKGLCFHPTQPALDPVGVSESAWNFRTGQPSDIAFEDNAKFSPDGKYEINVHFEAGKLELWAWNTYGPEFFRFKSDGVTENFLTVSQKFALLEGSPDYNRRVEKPSPVPGNFRLIDYRKKDGASKYLNVPGLKFALSAEFLHGERQLVIAFNAGVMLIDVDTGRKIWERRVQDFAQPNYVKVFADQRRAMVESFVDLYIVDLLTGERLYDLNMLQGLDVELCQVGAGSQIAVLNGDTLSIYSRRFPEWWWGHFCRIEVWAAAALSLLLLWRFIRWAFNPQRALPNTSA